MVNPPHNVLASINDIPLADGTLSGGYALSEIRVNVQRIFDVVVELGEPNPVPFERSVRQTIFDFQVTRVHASISEAEEFIFDHDADIPSSGPVKFTATDGLGIRYLINARLITHQLIKYIGKTTTHSYHIEGGRLWTSPAYFRLLESGGYRLLESGGRRELEH